MRVAYVGTFRARGIRHEPTEAGYARAFEALDCDVHRLGPVTRDDLMKLMYVAEFEPREHWGGYARDRLSHVPDSSVLADGFESAGHDVDRRAPGTIGTNMIRQTTEHVGLVLYTRSTGARIRGEGGALWRDLEARGIATAAVHQDLFVGIPERENEVRAGVDPFWHVGHWFSSDPRLGELLPSTTTHHWLPPGVDEQVCGRGDAQRWDGPEAPIVFIGSKAHPDSARGELVDLLERRFGDRFLHVGRDSTIGLIPKGSARLDDLYAAASVVIGHSYGAGTIDHYWSDRVPQTCARGRPLVHPRTVGLDDAHPHVAQFDTFDEMVELVDTVDEWAPDPLDVIEHTRTHHTYRARAATILRILDLSPTAV